MPKIRAADKKRMIERLDEATQLAGGVAEDIETYISQPDHDANLVASMGEAAERAHVLKVDSFKYVPAYEICEGSPLFFHWLYPFLSRIDWLNAPFLPVYGPQAGKGRLSEVQEELDELIPMMDGFFPKEWRDPACEQKWRQLQATLIQLRAITIQLDPVLGVSPGPARHFYIVATANLAAAQALALGCISEGFPYADLFELALHADNYIGGVAGTLRQLKPDAGNVAPEIVKVSAGEAFRCLGQLTTFVEGLPEGQ